MRDWIVGGFGYLYGIVRGRRSSEAKGGRTMKKTSEQGLMLLSEREGGIHTKAYLDTRGNPTNGVGHIGPEVVMGVEWTKEYALEIFRRDVQRFEDALNAALTRDIPQYSFDALVSWLYNVGAGWATKSTLMKLVNAGKMDEAAAAFDQWHIPPEITSRRNGEREQFKGTRFEPRID